MLKSVAKGGLAVLLLGISLTTAVARDQLLIVGSSTVFPFATAVAEHFGQEGSFKTPVVEATGSGGGFKLFCSGIGVTTPDITNSSRRIQEGEVAACAANSVTPVEVKIGFDGIVLVTAKGGPDLNLTRAQLFLALAKEVPVDGKRLPNPYHKWSDIDPLLPDRKIEVLGPPATSGTRDAFVELVMEQGCDSIPGARELGLTGKACSLLREDGAYSEAGENDNLIIQKLVSNPDAFGIFGFSFLDQNTQALQAVSIEGVSPEFDSIAEGRYPISRSLYFYVKKEHVGVIPGIEDYVTLFTEEDVWGPEGLLAEKGLIPLPDSERALFRQSARAMTPVSLD